MGISETYPNPPTVKPRKVELDEDYVYDMLYDLHKQADNLREECIAECIAHRHARDRYLKVIRDIHDALQCGNIEEAKRLAKVGLLK